jgi:hypothetical protein
MYAAFNARDIDALLEQMTPDLDWPNAWESGRVHGHEEVRDYWSRQWSVIDPSVEPVAFNARPDRSVAVEVDQVVRGPDGAVPAKGRVVHVYTFRDGLIARMDVEESGRDRAWILHAPWLLEEPRHSLAADASALSRSREGVAQTPLLSALFRPARRRRFGHGSELPPLRSRPVLVVAAGSARLAG